MLIINESLRWRWRTKLLIKFNSPPRHATTSPSSNWRLYDWKELGILSIKLNFSRPNKTLLFSLFLNYIKESFQEIYTYFFFLARRRCRRSSSSTFAPSRLLSLCFVSFRSKKDQLTYHNRREETIPSRWKFCVYFFYPLNLRISLRCSLML